MNHTPLPWNYQVTLSKAVVIWGDEKRITPLVATMDTTNHKLNEANARFIVTACNSYEATREALQKLLATTELNLDELEQETQEALAQAQAALALADGKEAQP